MISFLFTKWPYALLCISLEMLKPTQLYGDEEKRAKKAAQLAGDLGDGDSLLTSAVLEELGFAQPRGTGPLVTEGDAVAGSPGLLSRRESDGN